MLRVCLEGKCVGCDWYTCMEKRSVMLQTYYVVCKSAATRLLRLWVRILPGAWMFVSCECCVLLGRGLCDELITHPEESYRLCCIIVCDLETSKMRRLWPTWSNSAMGGEYLWKLGENKLLMEGQGMHSLNSPENWYFTYEKFYKR